MSSWLFWESLELCVWAKIYGRQGSAKPTPSRLACGLLQNKGGREMKPAGRPWNPYTSRSAGAGPFFGQAMKTMEVSR